MNKFSKYDLNDIISKSSKISIDCTAYSIYDIKEFSKAAIKSNCVLTLKNANTYSKSEVIEILSSNSNIIIDISNPENAISYKDLNLIKQEQTEQKKLLSELKKSIDNATRILNKR